MGWVHRIRDLGGVIFVDLRDREGITQVVFNPEKDGELSRRAKGLGGEDVIAVVGSVQPRPGGMANPQMATGEIEVIADDLYVISKAKTPPFVIEDGVKATEELRLKYRYLDLRRPEMQRIFRLRHRLYQSTRRFFDEKGFLEIETPFLMKSTPEGARDYLVPSRVHRGRFYALPQSPQLYKQLLMVAGFEKYFQIVKCFRDEDLRADRQPEFTQLDVEMSFVDEEDIFDLIERYIERVFREVLNIEIERPFRRLPYRESLLTYGTDKPDLRFGMEIRALTDLDCWKSFEIFRRIVAGGGEVCGLRVDGGAGASRKQVERWEEIVKEGGIGGLIPVRITREGVTSPIKKHIGDGGITKIIERFQGKIGDLILVLAGEGEGLFSAAGGLRLRLAQHLNLIDPTKFILAWIIDYPLLTYDNGAKKFVPVHHPFTAPVEEDIHKLGTSPGEVRARAYDLVLNGQEIAGGSIRLHDRKIQEKIFRVLGIPQGEAKSKFGFLLDALQYGAPPHGGIAFGFDRLAMIMAGKTSIREVIAFPKTTAALSLMDEAPDRVSPAQLKDLGLTIKKKNIT